MSAVELFESGDWAVRTIVVDGQPWFVAKDVCAALGISNPSDAVGRLDPDGVGTAEVIDGMGRPQAVRTVNEAGLYELIFQSRRPEAKAFRRWVTSEVLPAIRRTGTYSTTPALPEGDMLAHLELAVAGWRQEREGREIAEEKVAELEPAASAWTALAEDGSDWDVRTVAQLLSRDPAITIGRNRLIDHMRQVKWIDAHNQPYQAQVDLGRLVRKHGSYEDSYGNVHPTISTRVTVKGIEALHKQLGGAGPVAYPLAVVS